MNRIERAARALDRVPLAVPMALLLGVTLAFALFAMPGWWIARALDDGGIAAAVPALAPPLGLAARLVIALVGGLAGAAPVYALFARLDPPVRRARPRRVLVTTHASPAIVSTPAESLSRDDEIAPAHAEPVAEPIVEPAESVLADAQDDDTTVPTIEVATDPPASRWAAPLAWFRRKQVDLAEAGGAPTLRRQDAHPDAPARRPIFAASDLGAPLDAIAPGWAPDPEWSTAPVESEPLLLDPVLHTPAPPPAVPPAAAPQVAHEPGSAAALMARLDAALAGRPGRPASPPRAGDALRDAMKDLRRASRR